MNIHVFCNDGHRVLLDDYFRRTMKDDWDVVVHPFPTARAEDFGTPDFYKLMYVRTNVLIEEILPAEKNSPYFLFSDIDIQFFKPCQPLVDAVMRNAEIDIAFQRENWHWWSDINVGFIAMRANERVRRFWMNVRQGLTDAPTENEQAVANRLIRSSDLNWTFFPKSIWAFSNRSIKPEQRDFADRIHLHHANCTLPAPGKSSLDRKIEQMELVARRFEETRLALRR